MCSRLSGSKSRYGTLPRSTCQPFTDTVVMGQVCHEPDRGKVFTGNPRRLEPVAGSAEMLRCRGPNPSERHASAPSGVVGYATTVTRQIFTMSDGSLA